MPTISLELPLENPMITFYHNHLCHKREKYSIEGNIGKKRALRVHVWTSQTLLGLRGLPHDERVIDSLYA